jgi:hypothetical protein
VLGQLVTSASGDVCVANRQGNREALGVRGTHVPTHAGCAAADEASNRTTTNRDAQVGGGEGGAQRVRDWCDPGMHQQHANAWATAVGVDGCATGRTKGACHCTRPAPA